jgi:hypothetical protein
MTKFFCQRCGGPMEFELSEFQTAGITQINCPHCQNQIRLFDSLIAAPPVLSIQNTTAPTFSPRQKSESPAASFGQIISWLALAVFFGWSALIVLWGAATCLGWVHGGLLTTHSDAEQIGTFLGVVFSIAILFGIWLVGAVPSFLIWFIFKKR